MGELKEFINKIYDENIDNWVKNLNKNSKRSYINGLADFCKINDITPKEMLQTINKEEKNQIPTKERSLIKWFKNYQNHYKKLKRSEKTYNNRLTIVNNFISTNGFVGCVSPLCKRKTKIEKPKKNYIPSKEDINNLLDVSKTLKTKSIILTLASSGISASYLVNLKVKDFKKNIIDFKDINGSPRRFCVLSLNRNDGNEFKSILSEEAVRSIENYLEYERVNPGPREALFSKSKNGLGKISTQSIQKAFRNLNSRLGWYEKNKIIKPKMLSNFFKIQMIDAGMPDDMRKYLMGLKVDYIPENLKKLENVYFRHMDMITINPYETEYELVLFEKEKLTTDMEDIISRINELIKERPDIALINKFKFIENRVIEIEESYKQRLNLLEYNFTQLRKELMELKSK